MALEPIPESIEVKEAFKEHYKVMLGSKYEDFMKYSMSYIRKSIRVNTLKCSVAEIKKRLSPKWKLEQVPWCKEGFWIEYKGDSEQEKRFDIGNLTEHFLGYIYVQEAESMIPPVVLDIKPGMHVLDMCASPGSKSTQIAMYLENKGMLIANDNKLDRIKPLAINLQRCGVSNTATTLRTAQSFRKFEEKFDRVLCDVPCSGTGNYSKKFENIKNVESRNDS